MNKVELNRAILNAVSLNRVGLRKRVRKTESEDVPPITGEDYIASGVDILEIKNAKADSIVSLIVDGGCQQNGTPAPTAPIAIKCNKGNIAYGVLGKNLLEVTDANIVVGKYINNNGEVTASLPNLYFQRFVAVKASTAYTLSTSEALNYANFMEYDASGAFIKRTLYGSSGTPAGKEVTHTMGDTTAFVIVGSNVNSVKYPEITKEDVKAIEWMFCEGSSAKTYEAYRAGYSYGGEDGIEVYGKNLSVGELIGKGYASTGSVSTSQTFCGNLHKIPVSEGQKYTVSWGNLPDGMSGVFINTWKIDGSWNTRQAISATDKLTYTIKSGIGYVNFTLYKTGGITIGADTWLQVEYGDNATDYVPAITPTSEFAELLMGVGEYADTQDLIGGIVTRKVGVKVFDGAEPFISGNYGWITEDVQDQLDGTYRPVCTHFYGTTATPAANSNTVRVYRTSGGVGRIYFGIDKTIYPDEESFRQFLAMEYAKGTPVMVTYPLAEDVVENVAPQVLPNGEGDVTIIRDAEVKGLAMEATLKVQT